MTGVCVSGIDQRTPCGLLWRKRGGVESDPTVGGCEIQFAPPKKPWFLVIPLSRPTNGCNHGFKVQFRPQYALLLFKSNRPTSPAWRKRQRSPAGSEPRQAAPADCRGSTARPPQSPPGHRDWINFGATRKSDMHISIYSSIYKCIYIYIILCVGGSCF